jgi:hypothetical protein
MAIRPRIQFPPPIAPQSGEGLGDKLVRTIANAARAVLERLGEQIALVGGWIFVKFLELLEPSLLARGRLVIDRLAAEQNLPPEIKRFLEAARSGEGEVDAVAAWLVGLLSFMIPIQAVGQMVWSDWIYRMAGQYQIARPTIDELIRIMWRGSLSESEVSKARGDIGWSERFMNAVAEAVRPRLGEADLGELVRRRPDLVNAVRSELERRGWPQTDINLWINLQQRLPDTTAIINAFFRNELSETAAVSRLGQLGFSADDARLLIRLARWIPGPSDLIRMAVREVFDDRIAQKYGYDQDFSPAFAEWLAKTGGSAEWARFYWRAHWELPSPTQVFEMLHRGIISAADVDEYLRLADYAPVWRPRLRAISYNPVTRVDIRRMYRLGVIDRNEVKRRYQHLGYTPEDAELLTQFTEKYEGPEGSDELERRRELTRSVIEQAYYKRLIDHVEFAARLRDLRYDDDDIELLRRLVDARRAVEKAPDLEIERRNDVRNIVERLYMKGTLTPDQAREALRGVGFAQTEIDLILSVAEFARVESLRDRIIAWIGDAYIAGQLSRTDAIARLGELNVPPQQMDRHFADWDSQIRFRSRGLTEAQARAAWKAGIIDEERYRRELRGLGYSDQAIEVLVELARRGEKGGE